MSGVVAAGALNIRQVVQTGRDVAEAIVVLWTKRIVHRDIKPSNILVSTDGRSVLIDLGVARYLEFTTLTAPGHSIGTYGYMSPEQAGASRRLTCKSDIFSLGIVLQEALSGKHPTLHDQVALHNGGPSTATLRQGLPLDLAGLIDSMVESRPFKRPDPDLVAAELRRML